MQRGKIRSSEGSAGEAMPSKTIGSQRAHKNFFCSVFIESLKSWHSFSYAFSLEMSSELQAAFRKGRLSAYLELGFSLRSASRAIEIPYTTANRWCSQNFRLTRKEGSGRPRKTSSRTDRLIVRLAKADPTLSLTEMARVVFCSVSPSIVRRRSHT